MDKKPSNTDGESSFIDADHLNMVHRLIEVCLLFNLSKEQCIEALSRHADILPNVTDAVWKGLEENNEEFFEKYLKDREDRATTSTSKAELRQKIRELVPDSSKKK